MSPLSSRSTHRSLLYVLGYGVLTTVLMSSFGCEERALSGAVAPEGIEKGSAGVEAANKARRTGLKTLRTLWAQRKGRDITTRVLPLLRSSSGAVRKRATVMLGRLEDPRALKPLEAMRSQAPSQGLMQSREMASGTLYPELPLAIGRIKARDLSGQRKMNTVLSEVGLSSGGLVSLASRINEDKYGWKYLGNQVIEEAVDVLVKEKRRGRDVNQLISSLTLRPGQAVLLQAVSASSTTEAERLLDYMARARIVGGDETLVTENVLDLQLPPKVVLDKISAKLHDRTRYPNPFGLAAVLGDMAVQKDKRALTMLQVLAKDKSRGTTRQVAQSALNQITYGGYN